MTEIILFVDDKYISSDLALPFFQNTPFPGGHSFILTINLKDEPTLKKIVDKFELKRFSEVNWNSFFLYLSSIWPTPGIQEPLYFLNKIENMTIQKSSLCLNGICSPINIKK